jgi:hypothetical protein
MAYSFADVAWYVHNRLASIESLNGIARTCSGIARFSTIAIIRYHDQHINHQPPLLLHSVVVRRMINPILFARVPSAMPRMKCFGQAYFQVHGSDLEMLYGYTATTDLDSYVGIKPRHGRGLR